MAEEFVGMGVAVIVVTASIILAGILIGLGRGFGYKRVETFGIEELVQSIINSAIIGAFATIVALVGAASSGIAGERCGTGDAVAQLSCTLAALNSEVFRLLQEVIRALGITGYYQSLSLDFGAFSVSPFANLSSVSAILGAHALSLQLLMILLELNVQILAFISQNALALIFPAGLVLRTFFATRKVGGFLVALALGLVLFYPTFVLIFPNPQKDVEASVSYAANFTNNSMYAAVPVIDLNSNYALAGRLDVMSGRCEGALNGSHCQNFTGGAGGTAGKAADFQGDITLMMQSTGSSIAKVLLYSVVAPIFALLVAAVFVKELGDILGGEIGLGTLSNL